MQDYRYTNQVQCIVSPTFCRTIDTVVETSVSLALHFVGLSGNLQKTEQPRRKHKNKHQRNRCKLGKYLLGAG